jgi:pimeloyl-ACP methyl ester carboxylesterase
MRPVPPPLARAPRALAAAVFSFLIASCSAGISSLRPQSEIHDLAELVSASSGLVMERDTAIVPVSENENAALAVIRQRATQRNNSQRPLVVLIHGVLSNHDVWRFVAGDLGTDHDLLLVDLLGCGSSEKPDPGRLPAAAWSPSGLARQLLYVLRSELSGTARGRDLVLVGHSLGGSIILRMLGDPALRTEFQDVLAHVTRSVLFSPVDVAVERKHPVFESIVKVWAIEVSLGSMTGLLADKVVRATLEGTSRPDSIPREEAERMIQILGDGATRRAAQAMILAAVPYTIAERPDWAEIDRVVDYYKNIDEPCHIVWGRHDETFGVAMGYKLAAEIPGATLTIVPYGTHILPVESPRLCAGLVREFGK